MPKTYFVTAVVLAAAALAGTAARADALGETELRRLVYVTSLDGAGGQGAPGIYVYDIDQAHELVRFVPMPNLGGTRGACANAATDRMWISHANSKLLCLDLRTEKVLWEVEYPAEEGGADRIGVTPDGKKLYAPSGWWSRDPHIKVVDAVSGTLLKRILVAPSGGLHNLIVSLDGGTVFAGSTRYNMLSVIDTASDEIVGRVGPIIGVIQPLTVNGSQTLAYINSHLYREGHGPGFEIGDLRTGEILHVVGRPDLSERRSRCHGIGITPDEKEVWVVDQGHRELHVFDNTVMPPRFKVALPMAAKTHGWICFSRDGKFGWCDTGEVFDVATKKVIARWTDARGGEGKPVMSSKFFEIHFRGEDAIWVGRQMGVGYVGADTARAVSADRTALSKIDASMREFVASGTISGAVTLVAVDGRAVHHGAVGHADLEGNVAMAKDTIFAIASMTKPITATAIAILEDEGRLSVDDPVAKHLPAFADIKLANGSAPARKITIRDLLTHTSGVGDGPRRPIPTEMTLADLVDGIASQPLKFEPGSKWSYGKGLTVCGRIVEVLADQAFEAFLKTRIFEPLGMKDTSFRPTGDQRARVAKIYKPSADGTSLESTAVSWANPDRKRAPNPSGGLYSTARDMMRFYQAILNGGALDGVRVVSRRACETMLSIHTGDLVTGFTPGNGWGLGWCVVREPQGVTARLSPGTFGHGGAFGTQGWVDPERRLISILMIQRTELGNSDGSKIRRAFHELTSAALR